MDGPERSRSWITSEQWKPLAIGCGPPGPRCRPSKTLILSSSGVSSHQQSGSDSESSIINPWTVEGSHQPSSGTSGRRRPCLSASSLGLLAYLSRRSPRSRVLAGSRASRCSARSRSLQALRSTSVSSHFHAMVRSPRRAGSRSASAPTRTMTKWFRSARTQPCERSSTFEMPFVGPRRPSSIAWWLRHRASSGSRDGTRSWRASSKTSAHDEIWLRRRGSRMIGDF